MIALFFLLFPLVLSQLIDEEVKSDVVKCLVCKHTVTEIKKSITKINPNVKIDIGGYQIDDKGNKKQKSVEYRTSEVFLTEVMEKLCDKMEDVVKAKHKTTGEIMLLSLVEENGKMNPLMSEVDIIQDVDLNKNLKLYCEEVLDDHDEVIMREIKKLDESSQVVENICVHSAKLCVDMDTISPPEWEEETRDEL